MEKENENVVAEVVVDEDAELDAELNKTIDDMKSGNESPTEAKVEEPSTPPVEEAPKDEEYEFRVPNKGKFESDESYEKRIELMDLVKRRKLAKTEEQKQQLTEEIKTTKGQIKNLNGIDKITNPLLAKESEVTPTDGEEDEALKADKERLKQLGGATKEDIEAIIQKERLASEVKSTLDKFIDRHSELKDDDTREVFFDFVDSNYNWQNKSGKDLMTVLELARESMFRPSETIQERVLKGANVQEKVNAMQFPGGTTAKSDVSPELKKSIDELTATGMSEEKAIELLSD